MFVYRAISFEPPYSRVNFPGCETIPEGTRGNTSRSTNDQQISMCANHLVQLLRATAMPMSSLTDLMNPSSDYEVSLTVVEVVSNATGNKFSRSCIIWICFYWRRQLIKVHCHRLWIGHFVTVVCDFCDSDRTRGIVNTTRFNNLLSGV